MLFSGGLQRFYRLHLPLGYRNTVRHALIMNFHGHGASAQIQEHLSGMSNLADKEGFVVVYPQGTIGPDHRTGWNTGPHTYPHVNDVHFVSDLITHLEETLCIEPHRIYAAGFSNGGSLANVLACKLSDRIAAFAIASGGMHPIEGGCTPQRAASILEFHGTADQIVPYTGNSANDNEPPIEKWLADWVQRSGCNPGASIFFHRDGVLGEQWTNCRKQAVIVHYRITEGPHVWPRGSFTDANGKEYPNATNLIYQFFQEHPL
ncbi:esterase [Ktedonospora formicarum]|uniref:Esterase n=2 Tax=Ktedonospora formicarum TaxID=2778364 RepID=A0A8J3I3J9_9CHLR|nr:esterase [Ktedonospora formicarum]